MTLPGMSGSTVRVMRDGEKYRKVIGKSNHILTNQDIGHKDGRKVQAEVTAIHVAFSETFKGNIACLLTPEKLKWIWGITGAPIEEAPEEFYDENWPPKYVRQKESDDCNICSIF